TTVFNGSTAIGSGPVPLSSTVHDTTTLTISPTTVVPQGTVTYTLFTGGIGDCVSGTSSGQGTVTVGADGSVPDSNAVTVNAAGIYAFKAAFTPSNGDYIGVASDCHLYSFPTRRSSDLTTVFNGSTAIGSGPVP